MKAILFLGALVVTTPALAQTQPLPRYDAEGYCQQVADISGGSAMIYNGCIDMEQQAYRNLQRDWASIPASARSYCDEVAGFSGGSYSILQGCIGMETNAISSRRTFDY